MKAATYTGNRHITTMDGEITAPAPNEVVVDVAFCGLCGTDLHIVDGNMDTRVDIPHVPGHEMSGTISEVGAEATGWAVGDRVTVMPLHWDGTCPACLDGNQHICPQLDFLGVDVPGALQQRWRVPAATLVRLPDELDLQTAALIEPTAVAVHDVRRAELQVGDHVVVQGGGPIGLLIAIVARHAGASVLVAEVDPARRQRIEDLGFAVADPGTSDLASVVDAWTNGVGADVVFEVSGAETAVRQATALAKVRGTIVIVAIHPQAQPVDLQRVFWRELRILGARVYRRSDFERAVTLLETGVVKVDSVVTNVLSLDRTGEAVELLRSGSAMKVLIDVQGAQK